MTDPFTMSVTLTIQPERREEFLGALDAVLGPARAEPGCVFLHVGESTERRGTFVLFERWRDRQEYFEEILRRAHFQQYLALVRPRTQRPAWSCSWIPRDPRTPAPNLGLSLGGVTRGR